MKMMKAAKNSADLKKAVKAALIEVLDERQGLLFDAIKQAVEDIAFARAMDQADRRTVNSDKIDKLLKRGR